LTGGVARKWGFQIVIDERLLNPISTGELERRWTAVRKGMAERGFDALIMQNNNDWLGGYGLCTADYMLEGMHGCASPMIAARGRSHARRNGLHDAHRKMVCSHPGRAMVSATRGR
jgi:hypothetical protein